MQNKVVWINIKASKLGRFFFILTYTSLILVVVAHLHSITTWLALLVLLQGGWSWHKAFGSAAPVALMLEANTLSVQLAKGQLQLWQPPLLVISRFILVFKRPGLLAWPWFLWPDALTAEDHHQLRYFLRSWR